MEDFFAGVPWQITGWGAFMLLSFVILRALIKGDMIPGPRHAEILKDRDTYRDLFLNLRSDYDEREKTAWDATTAQGATMLAVLNSIWDHARGKEAKEDDRQAAGPHTPG